MSNELILKNFKDILESIQLVMKRSKDLVSSEDFFKNDAGLEKLDSISMRLQTIGEAIKKISKSNPNLLDKYHEVRWKDIIGFRYKISHHYFDLDAEVIFGICKTDIPLLEKVVKKILANIDKTSEYNKES